MTRSTPCLVRLRPPDLNGGPFGWRGKAVDQPLVTGRQITTYNTNGVELVDLLGNGQEFRDGPEGLASKIHIRPGNNYAAPLVREGVHDLNDSPVKKLRLVDGDNLRVGKNSFSYLNRARDGDRIELNAGMRTNPKNPSVPVI